MDVFAGNEQLKTIQLPKGLKTLGGGAFYGCKNLTSIDLSELENLKTLFVGTFNNCISLKSIKLPCNLLSISSDVVSYSGTFDGCKSLENIDLPNSLKYIGRWSFWNCESLKSITIPDNVTEIFTSQFKGCKNLKKVVLGKGLTSNIDYCLSGVFDDCPTLEELYSLSTDPTTRVDFPEEMYQHTKLFIPQGTAEKYGVTLSNNTISRNATTGWTPFVNVYEICETGIKKITDYTGDADNQNMSSHNEDIYDLMGNKHSSHYNQKGICIKNKEKVIIK